MILEIFKMWNQIKVEDCLRFPVNLWWFRILVPCSVATKDCRLTHGINLDFRKTFLVSQFSTFDSPRDHPQRIQFDDVQRNREAVPEAGRTKTIHTREDRLNHGTIPMPTFATKPWTTRFTIQVEVPQSYMVGQQRQQISELQFDKLPDPQSFLVWKIRFKNQVTTCSDFPSDAVLWIKEVEMVDSLEELKSSWSVCGQDFPELRDAGREDCLCSEQDHSEFPVQEEGQPRGAESSEREPVSTRKKDRLHDLRLLSSDWCSWHSIRLCWFMLSHSSRW